MGKPERLHLGGDMIPRMATPRPDDDLAVVACLTLELRRNGAMSITGPTGLLAEQMLIEAIDAVRRQNKHGLGTGLVIPGSDSEIVVPR